MDTTESTGKLKEEGNEEIIDNNDYYAVLGIPKSATEKQISSAYKKLALKYHPDRNQDNNEAAIKFKAVSDAYHVLHDPNKRRQYDVGGDKAAPTEFESVDVSSLGGIGRVFGAMISRLGVPIPTQIAPDIVETAQTICRNGGLEGGGPPLDPRVSDLAWGWAIDGKVDRQAAAYYRVNVDNRHVENGFVLLCRSASKGKFKVIMFDGTGSVLFQEESAKGHFNKKENTQAALYFTNFDTYRLGEPSLASLADKEVPPLFNKLESFTSSRHQITPGQYLICVYGDNFIGKTHFSITAVQAKNDANEVSELEEADESLLETKATLELLKTEYQQTKAAYESVLARMKTESEKIETVLITREKAYSGFFEASIREFSPAAAAVNPTQHETPVSQSTSVSTSQDGGEVSSSTADSTEDGTATGAATQPSYGSAAFSAAAAAANTATSVGVSAAHTATAAGGWIARRLSLGLQSIVKGSGERASEDSSSVPPEAAAAGSLSAQDSSALAAASDSDSSVSKPEHVVPSADSTESFVSNVAPISTVADDIDTTASVANSTEPKEEEDEVAESSNTDAAVESAESNSSSVTEEEVTTPTITRPVIRTKKDKKGNESN